MPQKIQGGRVESPIRYPFVDPRHVCTSMTHDNYTMRPPSFPTNCASLALELLSMQLLRRPLVLARLLIRNTSFVSWGNPNRSTQCRISGRYCISWCLHPWRCNNFRVDLQNCKMGFYKAYLRTCQFTHFDLGHASQIGPIESVVSRRKMKTNSQQRHSREMWKKSMLLSARVPRGTKLNILPACSI